MTVWPVIWRELRAQARRPITYGLRVLSAGALLAALWLAAGTADAYAQVMALWRRTRAPGVLGVAAFSATPSPPFPLLGSALFGFCHALIFLAIWGVVPLLMAESLSRERREGTLGLLFLTPLTAPEVVLGKTVVHGLQSLSLFLTVLPLLAVPLLLGGVSLADLRLALLLDTAALLLAMSAGLLASCLARRQLPVALLALLFSFLFALALMNGHDKVLQRAVQQSPPPGPGGAGAPSVVVGWANSPFRFNSPASHRLLFTEWLQEVFRHTANLPELDPSFWAWRGVLPSQGTTPWAHFRASYPPAMHDRWLAGVRWLLALALAWLIVVLALAASWLSGTWRERGPSPAAARWSATWCAPRIAPGLLRRRRRYALRRNPIGWLAQYSWKARLTKWGWCGGVAVALSVLSMDPWELVAGLPALGKLVLAGVALQAAIGFRHEIELRLMEPLLVTPLKPRQLWWGRMIAVWAQFLPAVTVLAVAYAYVCSFSGFDRTAYVGQSLRLAWAFVLLPVFGLCFSLFRWPLAAAWLATVSGGAAGPWLVGALAQAGKITAELMAVTLAVHLALAGGAGWLALRRLRRRRFALA